VDALPEQERGWAPLYAPVSATASGRPRRSSADHVHQRVGRDHCLGDGDEVEIERQNRV
jgi:hypothetical protein